MIENEDLADPKSTARRREKAIDDYTISIKLDSSKASYYKGRGRANFLLENYEHVVFTRDIDNNLTFSKNSYGLDDGIIDSNACFLIDLSQIYNYDFLNSYYDENDANLYLVESVYTMYGIENLAKILSEQSEQSFIDFAISLGLELKVETLCKNNKNGKN